ncbi:unnamed protein product [Bathycoccus prasinos]
MEGVRVAVYVVPEPVKLESFPPPVTVTSTSVKSLVDSLNPVKLESVPPPVTVTSSEVKSLVDSLDVNVKLRLASFEIKPLLPSPAVIVIVGDLVSYVHPKVLDSTLTLLLPAGSEYAFAATLID